MLPLQARVDLETMAMTGYSAFPKAPALLELYHQVFCLQGICWWESYPSVEWVYSTASADWAIRHSLQGGPYPLAENQLVYTTAPADWAICF